MKVLCSGSVNSLRLCALNLLRKLSTGNCYFAKVVKVSMKLLMPTKYYPLYCRYQKSTVSSECRTP